MMTKKSEEAKQDGFVRGMLFGGLLGASAVFSYLLIGFVVGHFTTNNLMGLIAKLILYGLFWFVILNKRIFGVLFDMFYNTNA